MSSSHAIKSELSPPARLTASLMSTEHVHPHEAFQPYQPFPGLQPIQTLLDPSTHPDLQYSTPPSQPSTIQAGTMTLYPRNMSCSVCWPGPCQETCYDELSQRFIYHSESPADPRTIPQPFRESGHHGQSFCGTLEPRMMLYHSIASPSSDTSAYVGHSALSSVYSHHSYSYYNPSTPCLTPSFASHLPAVEQQSSPTTSNSTMNTGLSKYTEDDEEHMDKPYAKLIFEALMQAPGHRMMLRDIYEWFVRNTNKPRESGTSGWQNSIRHNLSMNQAFENDKSEPACSRGQAKKANSVWLLTEDAVKHGVQSTTRYRKSGHVKKAPTNRTPAVQRQQSGARGGKAARRAARLRKQEELEKSHEQRASSAITPSAQGCDRSSVEESPQQMPPGDFHPATPPNPWTYDSLYGLAPLSHSLDQPPYAKAAEDVDSIDEHGFMQDFLSHERVDQLFDDPFQLQIEPSSLTGYPG